MPFVTTLIFWTVCWSAYLTFTTPILLFGGICPDFNGSCVHPKRAWFALFNGCSWWKLQAMFTRNANIFLWHLIRRTDQWWCKIHVEPLDKMVFQIHSGNSVVPKLSLLGPYPPPLVHKNIFNTTPKKKKKHVKNLWPFLRLHLRPWLSKRFWSPFCSIGSTLIWGKMSPHKTCFYTYSRYRKLLYIDHNFCPLCVMYICQWSSSLLLSNIARLPPPPPLLASNRRMSLLLEGLGPAFIFWDRAWRVRV